METVAEHRVGIVAEIFEVGFNRQHLYISGLQMLCAVFRTRGAQIIKHCV